jgi:hypothetical protein
LGAVEGCRGEVLDVFELCKRLVEDYGSYVRSFIRIKDARVEEKVKQSLDEGLLWPDPLIQLNPSFEAENLQCVGTSATLAGSGTYDEQRAEISRIATRLFGAEVRSENVIGETLRRATPDEDHND